MLETAKDRLKRIARYSRSDRGRPSGPLFLIAMPLLILILLVLVVAVTGGSMAAEMLRTYIDRIWELGSPLWR